MTQIGVSRGTRAPLHAVLRHPLATGNMQKWALRATVHFPQAERTRVAPYRSIERWITPACFRAALKQDANHKPENATTVYSPLTRACPCHSTLHITIIHQRT